MPSRLLLARAIVLGLIVAVGAFAIDMYAPGFAAIARDLHCSAGIVQMTMSSFFVALGVGQVIYGPISDAVGRRPPLFAGLCLFIVASAGAALAPSIGTLIGMRFLQGLGAAATAVIPMAVIRDEHTGPDAARLLALAMLALSVSPILAPVLGGLIVEAVSWRAIFVVLIGICIAIIAMVSVFLPETLSPDQRIPARPVAIAATYVRLLSDRRFILPIGIAALGQAILFAFITASPFIIVTVYGQTPTVYGIVFAAHAMALIGTSQFNAPMMRTLGAPRLIGLGALIIGLAGLALALLVLVSMPRLWMFLALTLTIFTGLGVVLAPAFLVAMEPFGRTAGAAAAIGSAFEFAVSSSTTLILSIVADGTARPAAVTMALSAVAMSAVWIGWRAREN